MSASADHVRLRRRPAANLGSRQSGRLKYDTSEIIRSYLSIVGAYTEIDVILSVG